MKGVVIWLMWVENVVKLISGIMNNVEFSFGIWLIMASSFMLSALLLYFLYMVLCLHCDSLATCMTFKMLFGFQMLSVLAGSIIIPATLDFSHLQYPVLVYCIIADLICSWILFAIFLTWKFCFVKSQ